MPHILSDETKAKLAIKSESSSATGATTEGEAAPETKEKKKKAPKKVEVKVIIAKIQRQKKKYITAIAGLEVSGLFSSYSLIFPASRSPT